MSEPTRYPLAWPANQPRTPLHHPTFRVGEAKARTAMLRSCELLGGTDLVLSTNIKLRLDGQPYANQAGIEDQGVALYFSYNGRSRCFSCDSWATFRDNYRAIGQAIEGMRAISRSGCPAMVDAALEGFLALPSHALQRHWTSVLGLDVDADVETIEARYRELAKKLHPDVPGGSEAAMVELNVARQQALPPREVG